ncbi:hypothetical protein EPO04_04170 [Patescibacteria group bacterium]|nr:MAG: hypothetical protein EPO04_04170 [Patescibacteria group bacterium]
MARLPIPGQDNGSWGDILNEYLSQSLSDTGELKSNTVGAGQIQDGIITETKLATAVQTKLNDTTVADGAITNAKVASGAAIAQSKLSLAITNTEVASGAAIARTKLDSSTQTSLTRADTAAAVYTYDSGTNSYVVTSSSRIFRGTVDPASVGVTLASGDIWINTSGP